MKGRWPRSSTPARVEFRELTNGPADKGDKLTEKHYRYDAFNRLSKRTHGDHVTRYFYTADDERIMRFGTEGFSWTLRDFGGQLLREFKPDVAIGMVPQRDHIHRGGSLIGTVTPNVSGQLSVEHHYSLDHLGSPRLIMDAVGQAEAKHKYYPFGEEATLSSQDRHPMKFTGHERDFNEAGEGDDLDYMHARLCDPQMGRFLSVDPKKRRRATRSPQQWNQYALAINNPIKYADPDGRDVIIKHKKDQAFYSRAARRNSRVRQLFAAFAPGTGRDLVIQRGDPGFHPVTKTQRKGLTDSAFREANPAELNAAEAAAGGGPKGTAAAEALLAKGIHIYTGSTITLAEGKPDDFVRLHELGHVEEALLDPEQAMGNANDSLKALTDQKYKESASEVYADKFANLAKKKDSEK